MQRTRSALPERASASSTAVSGLNASPTPSPSSRARRRSRGTSAHASTWNVTLSPPASAICAEVVLGVVHHQVAVEHAAAVVDERRDRVEHDRADRHRLDEVAVADVEVEDAGAGVQELARSARRAGEVGRVERRLHLDVRASTHARPWVEPTFAPGPRRSRRPVDMRKRQQELGPARVAEPREFRTEVVGREPELIDDRPRSPPRGSCRRRT